MILQTKLANNLYSFNSVKDVMAKANEVKSGDEFTIIQLFLMRKTKLPVLLSMGSIREYLMRLRIGLFLI